MSTNKKSGPNQVSPTNPDFNAADMEHRFERLKAEGKVPMADVLRIVAKATHKPLQVITKNVLKSVILAALHEEFEAIDEVWLEVSRRLLSCRMPSSREDFARALLDLAGRGSIDITQNATGLLVRHLGKHDLRVMP